MAENETPFETFKVPHSKLELKQAPCDSKPEVCDRGEKQSKPEKCKSDLKNSINVPLPYKEPDWSGLASEQYSFEVIKNGTFVTVIDIKTSYIVFGRLDVCNVILEHPSVSRYHAIVQYCKGDDTRCKGFYLYDLGSTHGTFLNKEKIRPNIYYKLKVGYILKFGGSTRLHIFQGPEEQEVEKKIDIVPNKVEEEICNWGIGEDAAEEEDLTENPFALATPNEDLYINDPKKTLRGWFEREGYELEYDAEEKGFKTFVCRVQLPIDNPTGEYVTVEASVSGKKKEAVVACALEACRTLDRYGVLRQSHHESRQHKKKKKWEEDDFYDSDEDTYLDRTGTIEKKREIRKKIEKKVEVETFQSLEVKFKAVTEEIAEIEEKLSASIVNTAQMSCDAEEDSLETYMTSLKSSSKAPTDKIEKSKLKFRLTGLEKEQKRLEKLLEIARPAKLPPVAKYPGMIGKKFKSKLNIPIAKPTKLPQKLLEPNEQEEMEEDESDNEKNIVKPMEVVLENVVENNSSSLKNSEILRAEPIKSMDFENEKINKGNNQVFSPEKPIIKNEITEKGSRRTIGPEMPEKKQDDTKKRRAKKTLKSVDVYSVNNAEYSTWIPPANQSGDGITHLNAKFGY